MTMTDETTPGITRKRLREARPMKISDIVVGTRHRKDMDDVAGLAASMKELGLLHPIVVRPDGALVAGERRLRAAKLLGWTEIPVNIIDLEAVTRPHLAIHAPPRGRGLISGAGKCGVDVVFDEPTTTASTAAFLAQNVVRHCPGPACLPGWPLRGWTR